MSGRRSTVFLVIAADGERLLRLGLWALTAASMGEEVSVLLTAPALREWVAGPFGEKDGRPVVARTLDGLPGPRGLLQQARELGPVRIVSCETEIQLAGLHEETVRAAVDEIVSLPSFWRESGDARLVTI